MKYIVVSGSVVSGLGKGVTSSSIGALLRAHGLGVTMIKIDPYLNVDAGKMSPFEHGEVYVLDDGGEVDLDLGSYERFLGNVTLTKDHNLTTGKVFSEIIQRERRGDFLGKTVQVVPHLTDAVQDWIKRVAHLPILSPGCADEKTAIHSNAANQSAKIDVRGVADVCLVEVGGTTGDMEGMHYLEALRMLKLREGLENFYHVHVSLVPSVGPNGGEHKTRPTQKGVRELLSFGLSPDLIVCRTTDRSMTKESIAKIAVACNLSPDHVISVSNTRNIYAVPDILHQNNVDSLIYQHLKLAPPTLNASDGLRTWRAIADHISPTPPKKSDAKADENAPKADQKAAEAENGCAAGATEAVSVAKADENAPLKADQKATCIANQKAVEAENGWAAGSTGATKAVSDGVVVVVGVVGKYTRLSDAYLSLSHAIQHAAFASKVQVKIRWIEADEVTPELCDKQLSDLHALIIPGGFGDRGVEGMITATNWARTHRVPFLGICLGLQIAVIEWARNQLRLPKANSTEFDPATPHPVVTPIPKLSGVGLDERVAQMCLGARTTTLPPASLAHTIYGGKKEIRERHRHRYQVTPRYQPELQDSGLILSGRDSDDRSVHTLELSPDQHPFFFATQFHPEFLSRPFTPSPPFVGLVAFAAAAANSKKM